MCWNITSWGVYFFYVNECEYRCYICSQSLKRAAKPNLIAFDGEELVAMGSNAVRSGTCVYLPPPPPTSIKTIPKHWRSSSGYETQTLSK